MYGVIVLGLLVAMLAIVLQGVQPLPILFYIGAAMALAGVLFGMVAVRCPYCRAQQPLRGIWYGYCPHCGEKLER